MTQKELIAEAHILLDRIEAEIAIMFSRLKRNKGINPKG